MPKPFVLALAAGVLVAAAPFVTMASNPILRELGDGSVDVDCSLLGLALESHRWSGIRPDEVLARVDDLAERLRGGCGLRFIGFAGAIATDVPPQPFDGRVECALLFALALLAAFSARRVRHAWVVSVPVAALGAWIFWALRADIVAFARAMPGGLEGLRLSSWIRPWPWILLGGAAALLVAASWQSRRIGRPAATRAVREIFE